MIAVRVHVEPLHTAEMPRDSRMSMLRGQLTVILRRAEAGVPVTVEAIARAERIARRLESEKLAA
jgi:hypothetical protein